MNLTAEFLTKISLQKRLSSRQRYASASQVRQIAPNGPYRFRKSKLSAGLYQRLGIVAERTSEIAAGKEQHASQSLAVHGRAVIKRVYVRFTFLHDRSAAKPPAAARATAYGN